MKAVVFQPEQWPAHRISNSGVFLTNFVEKYAFFVKIKKLKTIY